MRDRENWRRVTQELARLLWVDGRIGQSYLLMRSVIADEKGNENMEKYRGEQWRKQTHTLAEEFERKGYDKSACSLYRSIIEDARAEADVVLTPRQLSDALSARILDEYRGGRTYGEVGRIFGISKQSAWERAQNAIDAEDEAA